MQVLIVRCNDDGKTEVKLTAAFQAMARKVAVGFTHLSTQGIEAVDATKIREGILRILDKLEPTTQAEDATPKGKAK